MYDPPELRDAIDAWWSGLARALRREGIRAVPDRLTRGAPAQVLWGAPDLLITQVCGYPLVCGWADRFAYLATPHYAAPGCNGADYCSFIIVHADSPASSLEDLRGLSCAYNSRDSHSGYNVLRSTIAPLARSGRFFGAVVEAGSHAECTALVAHRQADVACIDAVTYALLTRLRPNVAGATRAIIATARAPGLPYVTRAGADGGLVARLRAGLATAAADPSLAAARTALLIDKIEVLPEARYAPIAEMEAESCRLGYPALA
jgi:ABC-type phosphate/phosphonate transport system substrate-binding protein